MADSPKEKVTLKSKTASKARNTADAQPAQSKSPTRTSIKKKTNQSGQINRSMVSQKNPIMAVIEEAANSPTVNGRRKGGSSSKKGGDAGTTPKSRKLRDMMKVGMIGLSMKHMLDSGSDVDLRKVATANGNSAEGDELQGEGDEQEGDANDKEAEQKEPKDSEEDSDVESMLREMDPVKRHIKQLKLKKKQMEQNRPKRVPRLSNEQRGWNAPQDQPYVPVGRMTELVSAVEMVRQNLPNTRARFKKQTYRQMLVIKKRERDLADRRRELRISSADASQRTNPNKTGPTSLSQDSLEAEDQKMEDTSRVVQKILPNEKNTLVQIRNYAFDETLRVMHKRRQSVPSGPRLNQYGRIAAGFVQKKNEKRDEFELKRKRKEALRLSASPMKGQTKSGDGLGGDTGEVDENGKPVIKTHIELQMEQEKHRAWIRKRNGKIYDEKIKNMILTTDNGSSLLKQEIQESEFRLAAVKLGRPLDEVVPKHPPDYFLTEKEDYFLGEKRVLRRQEKESWAQQQQQEEEEQAEPKIELGKEFQTIGSNNEGLAEAGGFFLTEQPIAPDVERKGVVRIPDLLEAKPTKSELSDEPVRVSQMFQSAQDANFEQVYRATTSHVKGLYLDRLRSREDPQIFSSMQNVEAGGNIAKSGEREMLKHQRANSFSTAAATTNAFYRSGQNISHAPAAMTGQRNSEVASGGTLNSHIGTDRLQSALTQFENKRRRQGGNNHQRLNSHCLYASEQNILSSHQPDEHQVNKTMSILESAPQLNTAQNLTHPMSQQNLIKHRDNQTNMMSRSHHGVQSHSVMTAQNARRLMREAKDNRAQGITKALKSDVSNRTNRVRYLQNLQKERIAQKKLDQAQGSNIFQGFSQEEIHEILVEMPQLKKMQKENLKLATMGPSQPQFSNAQLIHLDSLNDIANRGQAELRVRVMNQITQRRKKIHGDVNEVDQKYDLNDPSFVASNRAFNQTNQAIFKQFQKTSNEGYEDDIPTNYRWDKTLKERLNFADARQQNHLYQMFREEDFIHKIWEDGGPDHLAMDSDRQTNNQTGGSQKTLGGKKAPTLIDQIGTIFSEQQAQLERQSTQNLSQPQLRKMQTSISGGLTQPVNIEGQKQIDDEMREYDHSDQAILMKLIDVYEKRQSRNNERSQQGTTASQQTASAKNMGQKQGSSQYLKRMGSKQIAAKLNKKSSVAVLSQTQLDNNEEQHSLYDGNQTASNATLGLPPKPQKLVRKGTRNTDKEGTNSVSMNSLQMPQNSKKNSQHDVNSSRQAQQQQQSMKASRTAQSMMISTIGVQRDRKKGLQLKKDYRKFVIDCITKEYWRAFDALVGATDLEMELVIHSFNNNAFYREAKEFLVIRGKFMSEDHLIHLKEDPKTILSLYRMFMLHFKTTQMGIVDKKLVVRKKSKSSQQSAQPPKALPSGANKQSTASQNKFEQQMQQFDEVEESDYSDADFQDLMSNKQIEENIRVFFDRMHELVNPIDQQRLKLDSVQQIKSTVKTFYKRKADTSDKLLQELDQMSAERPLMIKVKQGQFNEPETNNQANLHVPDHKAKMPSVQQCYTRMTDVRLNAELHRLRQFKQVAQQTAVWYNELASRLLAEQIQDEPLVLYMLDQIKNVIEIGQVFTRSNFQKLMNTFDAFDAQKQEVIKVFQFLDELLPQEETEYPSVNDLDQGTVADHEMSTNAAMMMNNIESGEGNAGPSKMLNVISMDGLSQPKPSNRQRVPSRVTFEKGK